MPKNKPKVNKNSSSYLYQQQWKRINAYIKKLSEQGFTVDETELPEKLSRPNKRSVEKLKHEWDFRQLKKIAYAKTETGQYRTNESGQRISKSNIEYEEWRKKYTEKREQINRQRRAKRWVDKAARSWDFVYDDFDDAIKELGVTAQTVSQYNYSPYGAIKRKETKYVEIEDIGIKKSDVAYRWKLIGEEDGMRVFQPKNLQEKVYVDEANFKFYVKRSSIPSVEGNAIEAINSLIPSLDYYTTAGGKWGELGAEVSQQLSSLIDVLRNVDDEKYEAIMANISNNIGQIDSLMHGLLYEYKEMQNSSTNIAKLYKLITGESMTSEVANRINNYQIDDMYLDDEY